MAAIMPAAANAKAGEAPGDAGAGEEPDDAVSPATVPVPVPTP